MINLLPVENQDAIRREYRRRVLAVLGVTIGVAVIIGGLELIPALLVARDGSVALRGASRVADERLSNSGVADVTSRVEDITRKASFIAGQKRPSPPSVAIERIVSLRPAGIRIVSLDYVRGTPGTSIAIKGVASSRRVVVAFVDALESERSFSSVTSPVSNLLKEADTDFTLSLTVSE